MPLFDFDHALALEGPPTFADGLAAAMDERHSFLVTSPNADFVPEIVQGIVDIILRVDGKYGPMDPIQWPQIFVPRYPYLATIPKRVEVDHRWAPIWRGPALEDFVALSGTPISGFGFLSTSFLAPLRAVVSEMCQIVDRFVQDIDLPDCQDLRWHQLAMRHSLQRLTLMPATFPDQTLQVAELQRHWLMAAGYLEFQRRSRSLANVGGFTCADLRLMGAWTSDPQSVQILFDAMVPVWFVRHLHLLQPDVRIRHKTTPLRPTMLCGDRFPGVDTPVFHGLVGESHVVSMMQGGHGYRDISLVPTAAVYDLEEYRSGLSMREAKAATLSQRGTSGSTSTSQAQAVVNVPAAHGSRMPPAVRYRPKPYDKVLNTTPHPSQIRGRDKFLEFPHKWMPPPIASWSQALAAVDRSMPARPSDQLWGYWVPEPALVLGPKDEDRQRRYLTNWISARPIWLYLLHVPGSRAYMVPPQYWRSFLNSVPDDPSSTTRNGKRLIDIKNVFGAVFSQEEFNMETDDAVSWHDKVFQSVPDTLAPAVIWELFELGFRYELMALDRFLRPPERISRQEETRREDLLSKVFPNDWLRALESLPSPDSPGLFATLPHRRIQSLNALRTVLVRWPGCPSCITTASLLSPSDEPETIVRMEQDLATFYVDMFFLCSGRAPLLPRLYPA